MLSTAGFSSFLTAVPIYCVLVRKGGRKMRECSDPTVDIEDLLYDDDAGGPSER